ncbi:MAG: DUF1028 domain-containing protein [Nocardioidaceae bacterium]
MTFSLAGRCARTGRFGAIVSSSSPAVAARCAWARAGVGAAMSQNITDPTLGTALLDALAAGASAQEALDQVVASGNHAQYRQLTVVDGQGRAAAFSGEHTLGTYASAVGTDAVAAGNLLSGKNVPDAMLAAFAAAPDDDLGDRLVAALRAGSDAGGEAGPVHSAGMLVVDRVAWPVTDLRVDWSDDPITDLEEVWQIWKPQADDYVTRGLDPRTAPAYGVPGDE